MYKVIDHGILTHRPISESSSKDFSSNLPVSRNSHKSVFGKLIERKSNSNKIFYWREIWNNILDPKSLIKDLKIHWQSRFLLEMKTLFRLSDLGEFVSVSNDLWVQQKFRLLKLFINSLYLIHGRYSPFIRRTYTSPILTLLCYRIRYLLLVSCYIILYIITNIWMKYVHLWICNSIH